MNSLNSIEAYPQPAYRQDLVIEALHKAAQNELLTCSLYRQVKSAELDETRVGFRDLAYSAYEEDWNHYQTLQECISLLQAEVSAQNSLASSPALLPPPAASSCCLLGQIEQAEKTSIHYQQAICAMTIGYNYKVFDLAYSLLNENIQHNLLVQEYLTGSASQ
ncbi:hypothetical protein [Aliamphritea ceti]|uniref:hypothetical protein n=1 Tax=Aliamphritea ceti TaxID=1524258 RepID=UPI0021C31FDA|nr:hypothetical protein [Aliamphritea ceti]